MSESTTKSYSLQIALINIQNELKVPKSNRNTFGNYNYRSCEDILEAVKYIDYDPQSGEITRLGRKNSNGSIDAYGYRIIKINGVQWKAHRLAWAKYHGIAPRHNIDHIDNDKTKNSIDNLRDVRQAVNVRNVKRQPNKDTGVVGVYVDHATKGLKAKYTTRVNGKMYRFATLDEAINLRKEYGL